MSTQQDFINGFVKRAAQYGVPQVQAINLLKSAGPRPTQQKPMAPAPQFKSLAAPNKTTGSIPQADLGLPAGQIAAPGSNAFKGSAYPQGLTAENLRVLSGQPGVQVTEIPPMIDTSKIDQSLGQQAAMANDVAGYKK